MEIQRNQTTPVGVSPAAMVAGHQLNLAGRISALRRARTLSGRPRTMSHCSLAAFQFASSLTQTI